MRREGRQACPDHMMRAAAAAAASLGSLSYAATLHWLGA